MSKHRPKPEPDLTKKVTWKIYCGSECSDTFSKKEEAVNLLTEVALENVLNIVMNNFPPECKVSEYLDDILVTLDSCQSDFGDYKVVKETVEVNTLEMEVLRAKWHAQLAQDFKDWDQSERDQKEKEERAQLTKLKAKYE